MTAGYYSFTIQQKFGFFFFFYKAESLKFYFLPSKYIFGKNAWNPNFAFRVSGK